MTKKLSIVLVAVLVVGAVVLGLHAHLVDGALVKKVYFSSDRAIEHYSGKGQEVVYDFQAEGIRIFFVDDDGTLQMYVLKKQTAWWALGAWTYAYPSLNNIQAITPVGSDIYICNLGAPGTSMYLQTDEGQRIDPVDVQTMYTQGASPNPEGYIVNIIRIEDYAEKPGDYQVMIEDAAGNNINAKASEFDLSELTVYLLTPDGTEELSYSPEEAASLNDGREQVIEVFLETIAEKTAIEPTGFEGSKLPTTQQGISTTTILGNYYTVEGKDKVYGWVHRVTYQLMLNGDYYKNILTRHESIPPFGASKVDFYHVDSSEELQEIFKLFYPNNQ